MRIALRNNTEDTFRYYDAVIETLYWVLSFDEV